MPRQSSITDDLMVEVRQRRDAGEPWKVIARDMADRGLPHNRVWWWAVLRRDVCKRQEHCDAAT